MNSAHNYNENQNPLGGFNNNQSFSDEEMKDGSGSGSLSGHDQNNNNLS